MKNGNEIISPVRKNVILKLMNMATALTRFTYVDGELRPYHDSNLKIINIDINPELASEILVHNIDNNRNIRKTRLQQYEADLASSNWKSNGEPIFCTDEGILVDGQHRLTSIIKSGITMRDVPIIFVPAASATNYDTGAGRSTRDVAKLNGKTAPIYTNGCVLAAFKSSLEFTANYKNGGITNSIKLAEVEKHQDAAYFILRSIISRGQDTKRGLNRAGFTAVILNAYLSGINPQTLKNFIAILTHTTDNEPDIKMVNYLSKFKEKLMAIRGGGNIPNKEAYYRTQEALHRYIINKPASSCPKEYKELEYYSYPTT